MAVLRWYDTTVRVKRDHVIQLVHRVLEVLAVIVFCHDPDSWGQEVILMRRIRAHQIGIC